jgi:hypothetical protein
VGWWKLRDASGNELEPRRLPSGETQADVVKTLFDDFQKSDVVMLVAPQGYGKTFIALNLASVFREDDETRKILYITPNKVLQEQVHSIVNVKFKVGEKPLKAKTIYGLSSVHCAFEFNGRKLCMRDPTACPLRNVPSRKEKGYVVGQVSGYYYYLADITNIDLVAECEKLKQKRLLPEAFDCNDAASNVVMYKIGGKVYSECPFYAQLKPLVKPFKGVPQEVLGEDFDADVIVTNEAKLLYEEMIGRILLDSKVFSLIIIDEADEIILQNFPAIEINEDELDMLIHALNELREKVERDSTITLIDEIRSELLEFINELRMIRRQNKGKHGLFLVSNAYLLSRAAKKALALFNELNSETVSVEPPVVLEEFAMKFNDPIISKLAFKKIYYNFETGNILILGDPKEALYLKLIYAREGNEFPKVLLVTATPLRSTMQVFKQHMGAVEDYILRKIEGPHYGKFYLLVTTHLPVSGKLFKTRQDYRMTVAELMSIALEKARKLQKAVNKPILGLYAANTYLKELSLRVPGMHIDTAKVSQDFARKALEQYKEVHSTRAWRGLDVKGGLIVFIPKFPYPDTTSSFIEWLSNNWSGEFEKGPVAELGDIKFIQGITRGSRGQDDPVYIVSPDTHVIDWFMRHVERGELTFGGLVDEDGRILATDVVKAKEMLRGHAFGVQPQAPAPAQPQPQVQATAQAPQQVQQQPQPPPTPQVQPAPPPAVAVTASGDGHKSEVEAKAEVPQQLQAQEPPQSAPQPRQEQEKVKPVVEATATKATPVKGQVSLKAFMPQEASKQVESKSAKDGGVDVSEILRPEVVLKPINDPEALRRAVREFFEPWIIEEPDPRWLRVKRKYTMKLVEAVDKAKSIEELNEMIARIEAEESQELAQLEQELHRQSGS